MPDPAGFTWTEVAADFDSPLGVIHSGDSSGRLFVIEQGGLIWVIGANGEVGFEPFLDIGPLLPGNVFRGGYTEQGLLGLAFPPDYGTNPHFFISYTRQDGDTVIARYRTDAQDLNRADPDSGEVVFTTFQPYDDHNGGHIAFGPDGYLYIGLGDGGALQDPLRMGQRTSTHLGKILRIDVSALPYTIPPDNPFVGDEAYKPEIWALGVRNPWRFQFDRQTGDLWIGDVGQEQREEVNVVPAGTSGQNFGWSAFEGTLPLYADQEGPVDAAALTFPVAEYPHTDGCSVTGGFVYRGPGLPALQGKYLFGDYCSGRLWLVEPDGAGGWRWGLWSQTPFVISSFGESESGELLLVDYKGGVYRLDG